MTRGNDDEFGLLFHRYRCAVARIEMKDWTFDVVDNGCYDHMLGGLTTYYYYFDTLEALQSTEATDATAVVVVVVVVCSIRLLQHQQQLDDNVNDVQYMTTTPTFVASSDVGAAVGVVAVVVNLETYYYCRYCCYY